MNAIEKLKSNNSAGKFICVGLDTDINKIPKQLLSKKNPILEFNKSIIEATKDYAAAYKINLAFYESDGAEGLKNLALTLEYIPDNILTIADGKRGDIGNTSLMYAKSIYEHYNFDSATLNAYMGKDSLTPFLDYNDKLNFVLALTSNPGSEDFQKLILDSGKKLFQQVIKNVSVWNINKNCGIVFGATNTEELKNNIENFDDLPLLLPGIGAQGGDLKEVVKIFSEHKNLNFLVNVSRGIIYSSSGEDFIEAARNSLSQLNKEIAKYYL